MKSLSDITNEVYARRDIAYEKAVADRLEKLQKEVDEWAVKNGVESDGCELEKEKQIEFDSWLHEFQEEENRAGNDEVFQAYKEELDRAQSESDPEGTMPMISEFITLED
jgi:restriction endonuclease S subunit